MSANQDRSQLCRWVGWFFCINVFLVLAVELSYLRFLPQLHAVYGATDANITLASFFLGTSYIAHATLVCFFCAALSLVVAYCYPKRWWVFTAALLPMTILLASLVIDNVAYSLYHSHQIAIGMIIIKAGAVNEEMPLSLVEYVALGLLVLSIVLVEGVIAWLVWRRLQQACPSKRVAGKVLGGFFTLSVLASFGLMAFVVTVPPEYRFAESTSHLMLKMARLVPYYHALYTSLVPGSEKETHLVRVGQDSLLMQSQMVQHPVQYPLHPMQCHPPKSRPNILYLVIDTLRYDAVTPSVMPKISQFAQHALQFDHTWSGGNCTRPGVFSMFYGIPANYWNAMLAKRKGPIMLSELQKAGYQMGIYASATLNFPQFSKTVFADVKNLETETPGETSVARDRAITKRFQHFLDTRNPNKPFFGFLFYDAVHNYCEGSEKEHQNPFHPAVKQCTRFTLTKETNPVPYINRYHNAAHFIDAEAGKVFAMLKARNLLKNTIVVITADHGEQFNDQHMDYWSHASAYTPYQLHIPMMIYWPGKAPRHYGYFVTNHDLPTTILKDVLQCQNPTADYATGHSLFNPVKRPFYVVGSYTDYAVVTPKTVTRIYANGDYTLNNALGHARFQTPLSAGTMKAAYQQLTRFFSASKSQVAVHHAHLS